MRQAQDRDIQHIGIRVMLFKAMVLPVMSYGCEIWSLPFYQITCTLWQSLPEGSEHVFDEADSWELA
jgi:hypothetical protein